MLKKGKYIHRVEESNTGLVVYVNLFNNSYLKIEPDKVWAFDDALANPNSNKTSPFGVGVREILSGLGFLVDSDFDELLDLQKRFFQEKGNMELLSVGIVLTKACNFRCVYCNQEHTSTSFSNDDSSKVVRYVENHCLALKD